MKQVLFCNLRLTGRFTLLQVLVGLQYILYKIIIFKPMILFSKKICQIQLWHRFYCSIRLKVEENLKCINILHCYIKAMLPSTYFTELKSLFLSYFVVTLYFFNFNSTKRLMFFVFHNFCKSNLFPTDKFWTWSIFWVNWNQNEKYFLSICIWDCIIF